jgi:hypothetical protein
MRVRVLAGAAVVLLSCGCGSRPDAVTLTTSTSGNTRLYSEPVVLKSGETRHLSRGDVQKIGAVACISHGMRVSLIVAQKGTRGSIPGGPLLRVRYLGDGSLIASCQ